jgi:hypothetical protein
LIAPVAEPISETGIRERSVQIIHKERQVTARRAVYDPLQNWKDRQRKLFRFAVSALALCERQLAVADVLPPESDHVRSPLPREQKKRQRKPRLCPNRVTLLELANFLRSPTVESG